jgi:hypothetical protein
MNRDADCQIDDEFALRLAACDEALAAGTTPRAVDDGTTPQDLRDRLARGLACVELLQQLRPQPRSDPGPTVALDTRGLQADGSTAAPPLDAFCPARIGRFEIRRALGQGGFGVVYLAYDPVLARDVALKVPRLDALADDECRARFQQEARSAAGLDHPNLVSVHEAGQVGPVLYIALAYCPGYNLAEWLKQGTSLVACEQAARLLLMLADAIHYAHSRGVLHRDLKPSNVLLTPVAMAENPVLYAASSGLAANAGIWQPQPGARFIPRVTDFGLSKQVAGDQHHTQTGAVLGTPSYMAPEQAEARAGEVGPATDVYALGAILYELLTGHPPFVTDTALDTLLLVKTAEPVPPRRLCPKIPCDLETICLKCLQKEPRQRYATAAALADDLRLHLGGKAIHARPVSAVEHGWRWCRRYPAVASLMVAFVLSLVGGICGVTWKWLEADNQRTRAVAEKRISEAVQSFLQRDLLQQLDAVEQANAVRLLGGGFETKENPTIRELLDRAAAELTPDRIDVKFPGQPEVQASILHRVQSRSRALFSGFSICNCCG